MSCFSSIPHTGSTGTQNLPHQIYIWLSVTSTVGLCISHSDATLFFGCKSVYHVVEMKSLNRCCSCFSWSILFDVPIFETPWALNSSVMSYPSTEVICGKCGTTISKIINLRPIRDIIRTHGWRCKTCGNALSPSDFTIDIERL